jgi:hypothetical protein
MPVHSASYYRGRRAEENSNATIPRDSMLAFALQRITQHHNESAGTKRIMPRLQDELIALHQWDSQMPIPDSHMRQTLSPRHVCDAQRADSIFRNLRRSGTSADSP